MTNNKYQPIETNLSSVGLTDFNGNNGNLIGIGGCLVLLVESGYAIASIGFKKRLLRKGSIAILFYDDSFRIIKHSSAFSTRYVHLPYTNVQEAIYKITSPNLWGALSENPVLKTSVEQWKLVYSWWEHANWMCSFATEESKDLFFRNHIHNLFLGIQCELEQNEDINNRRSNRSWGLMVKFLKLLSQYCKENREASFYANKLCITTTYLNKLTHRYFKMSPKALIDEQALCEIKTYLSNTDLSIKNIATAMRFDDVPYFCRYFRRLTGQSPMKYREQVSVFK